MSRLLPILLYLALAGCNTLPASPLAATHIEASSFEVGANYQQSVGEIIADYYRGAWLQAFKNPESIEIEGREPVPAFSTFVARSRHSENGKLVVVSDAYHPDVAFICDSSGKIDSAEQAVQIGGARRGRRWPILGAPQLEPSGYRENPAVPGREGWKLQYVGTRDNALRFTIQELGLDQQRMGQVEYQHDLGVGKEFVFRGTRIRVDAIDPDGTLRYVILSSRD